MEARRWDTRSGGLLAGGRPVVYGLRIPLDRCIVWIYVLMVYPAVHVHTIPGTTSRSTPRDPQPQPPCAPSSPPWASSPTTGRTQTWSVWDRPSGGQDHLSSFQNLTSMSPSLAVLRSAHPPRVLPPGGPLPRQQRRVRPERPHAAFCSGCCRWGLGIYWLGCIILRRWPPR